MITPQLPQSLCRKRHFFIKPLGDVPRRIVLVVAVGADFEFQILDVIDTGEDYGLECGRFFAVEILVAQHPQQFYERIIQPLKYGSFLCMKTFLLLTLMIVVDLAAAQNLELGYTVSYSVVKCADISVKITDNQDYIKISATGRSCGIADFLFKVDEKFVSLIPANSAHYIYISNSTPSVLVCAKINLVAGSLKIEALSSKISPK